MNKKGKIVCVDANKAKVLFDDPNIMTTYLDIAQHVSLELLTPGTYVIVTFYNMTMKDGIIMGVIR